MFGDGKECLRSYIKSKRASEGLEEIPEDLFAKKPRHEMTEHEMKSMLERRKRNKEAAERSRKKKKVEFEKLQSENDQLNQEKCELVAMVQKLREDVYGAVKENELLRKTNEQLKRWIGKRSFEFGLTKYIPSDDQSKVFPAEAVSTILTSGNPFLNASDNVTGTISRDKVTMDQVPPKPSSPPREQRADRPQPSARPKLQTPWLVDSVVKETPTPDKVISSSQRSVQLSGIQPVVMSTPRTVQLGENQPMVVTSSPPRTVQLVENPPMVVTSSPQCTVQLGESQPMVVSSGPPVVYVPKDAIIVRQDSPVGGVVKTGTMEPRVVVSPKLAVEPPEMLKADMPRVSGSSSAVLHGSAKNDPPASSNHGKETWASETHGDDAIAGMDPATATAIESLLKLGYKIKLPNPEAAPEGHQ
ncbi:uncharacterized protein LOC143293015 [Babylonia areolata]|uniref:uncharacterized protein LOC143293015 n=1 Tax=Babylonia areolata TaxID=304850 RepID=UPI003FD18385